MSPLVLQGPPHPVLGKGSGTPHPWCSWSAGPRCSFSRGPIPHTLAQTRPRVGLTTADAGCWSAVRHGAPGSGLQVCVHTHTWNAHVPCAPMCSEARRAQLAGLVLSQALRVIMRMVHMVGWVHPSTQCPSHPLSAAVRCLRAREVSPIPRIDSRPPGSCPNLPYLPAWAIQSGDRGCWTPGLATQRQWGECPLLGGCDPHCPPQG